MDIHACITSLLTVHDCVIIPGFGGFIGNYAPARIDPVHHAFQPPSKKLLFNINLKQNDGLLATAVAGASGTSYEEATGLVELFAEEIRMTLKAGKSFVIPGTGRLYAGREGNIQFEQDKTANLLTDAFGLSAFISPPIIRNAIASPRRLAAQTEHETGSASGIHISRPLKWAAILAIPITAAAFIGITQFHKLSNDPSNSAGILSSVFSRFSSTALIEKKVAPENPPAEPFSYESTPSAFERNDLPDEMIQTTETSRPDQQISGSPSVTYSETELAADQQKNITASGITTSEIPTDGRYIIIVGAFKSKENAERFISDLENRGTRATVYDRSVTGLYRVTIGTFSQYEEASQLLATARSGNFSGAWLLKK